MTDLNATTRKLRKDRKLAVLNFARALGFHEDEVKQIRDITIKSREVVVHKYATQVNLVTGKVERIKDEQGDNLMTEITLFTHEQDIDDTDAVAQVVGLVEAKPGSAFGVK